MAGNKGNKNIDRGALAQCLNATSQIAAECNSILRDLLRGRSPQQEDLQRLASQVLVGQTLNLQELQKKMESQQATLAELLKVLKPSGSGDPSQLPGDGTYGLPQPSLSVIKGWDSYRDAHFSGGSTTRRRRPQKGQQPTPRNDTMTKRDRYTAIESFWKSLSPEARQDLLKIPVSKILQVATPEHGEAYAKEIIGHLQLLKSNSSRHACYWLCPCCDYKAEDAKGFLVHMRQYHEEVQYVCEDTPHICTRCSQEVVGAYYRANNPDDKKVVCLRCSWELDMDSSTTVASSGGGGADGSNKQQQQSIKTMLKESHTLFVPTPTNPLDRSWSSSMSGASSSSSSEESSSSSYDSEDSEEAGTARSHVSSSASEYSSHSDDDDSSSLSSEIDELESKVRAVKDGLPAAILDRVEAIEQQDRQQFEAALSGMVQQAQRLMGHALTAADIQERNKVDVEARKEALVKLTFPEDFPNQVEQLQSALCLLNPTELQDLLALLARLYSPSSGSSRSNRYARIRQQLDGQLAEDWSPGLYGYEPPCASLLHLVGTIPPADNGADQQQPIDTKSPISPESDVLDVQPWWSAHLINKSWQELGTDDALYLLQWICGNVAYFANDDFLERQRLACGPKTQSAALFDAFGEIAETWRHLAATIDRRRHINSLREAVSEDIEAVQEFETEAIEALRAQALEFITEIKADGSLAMPPSSSSDGSSSDGAVKDDGSGSTTVAADTTTSSNKVDKTAWSQRALVKLQCYHQLKDEGSIRYAQALIDREIAVLELAEVMDQHQCDVAERELQSVDAALAAAREELEDAQAELARAKSEGPASHRKKDLLDKVNKEAEHRERLQELQQHIVTCTSRINNEETFGEGARKRREDAVADLTQVRNELQTYIDRRNALDAACHNVLVAQERDKGQELTAAYVDARIRAVWQVVTGVAAAIYSLADRYKQGEENKEAARHKKSMSLAKQLSRELEERIRVWGDDLDKLRRRAVDLACVDAGQTVEAIALECIRQHLEDAAAAAREAATMDLLRELEEEEAAKKAAESKKAKKKASKAAASSKKSASTSQKEEEEKSAAAKASSATAKDTSKEEEEEAIDPDVLAEMEYEAALERRRQELAKQEADRRKAEQELLKQAEASSLKDSSSSRPVDNKPRVVVVQRSTATVVKPRGPAGSAPAISNAINSSVVPPPPPPGKPPPVLTSIQQDDAGMRVVTYFGDWLCICNKVNRLWDTCVCGQVPPCRDWVRGRCSYRDRCRFPHPPFELPDTLPRPKSPIAKPGPDAIVFHTARPGVAAAAAMAHAAHTNGSNGHDQYHHQPPAPPPRPPPPPMAPKPAVPAPPSGPPPPLKPAPWAALRPGTAVTTTAQPTSAPAVAAPQPPAPAPTNTSNQGGFDLFGGSSLLQGFAPTTAAPVANGAMPPVLSSPIRSGGVTTSAFGLSSPNAAGLVHSPVQATSGGLFGGVNTAAAGGGFFHGDSFDSSTAAHLQQQHHQSLGGGVMHTSNTGGLDDWGDLQLQLPSDLGEMLGADDHAMPAMTGLVDPLMGGQQQSLMNGGQQVDANGMIMHPFGTGSGLGQGSLWSGVF